MTDANSLCRCPDLFTLVLGGGRGCGKGHVVGGVRLGGGKGVDSSPWLTPHPHPPPNGPRLASHQITGEGVHQLEAGWESTLAEPDNAHLLSEARKHELCMRNGEGLINNFSAL